MSTAQVVFTAVVAVLASARLTRLIVADTYPPVAWLRSKWAGLTHDGEWAALVSCSFCAAPYVSAVVLALGYWLDWPTWWYVACCWLAVSYAAAIVVQYDEPS